MISIVMLIALLLGPAGPLPMYRLTVTGGSGSGVYPCGAVVRIVGDKTRGAEVFGQWFAGWDGDTAIDSHHQRKASLKMPCHDAQVEARFTAKPPKRTS